MAASRISFACEGDGADPVRERDTQLVPAKQEASSKTVLSSEG
jgi:hypothetical protein